MAHALAYLHHDCLPAIIHGDVKAMNVLLGPGYQPYVADFGLVRTAIENGDYTDSKPLQRHYLASSYGYMAGGILFYFIFILKLIEWFSVG